MGPNHFESHIWSSLVNTKFEGKSRSNFKQRNNADNNKQFTKSILKNKT